MTIKSQSLPRRDDRQNVKRCRTRILTALLVLVNLCVTSCGKAADAVSMQGVTPVYSEEADAGAKAADVGEISNAYSVAITVTGGTGKATIKSPVEVSETGGKLTAKLVWTSKNYDYMIVNGIKYVDENPDGESTFHVVIDNLDPLTVTADTTAMSTPHEIEYVITFGEVVENGMADGEDAAVKQTDGAGAGTTDKAAVAKSLEAAGLSLTESVDLQYASCFTIDRYGDYDLLSVPNSGDYLLIPEGGMIPQGLPAHVVLLQKPLDHTYLVSTSAMDLIRTCGALDFVKLSGTTAGDWYIPEAKAAMENGSILYAGKYRSPDYELLLESGCDLAIENTMIYHEPAVKEKLTELSIPVFVETSSYEAHPLGRLEWIKLYGVLFGKEAERLRRGLKRQRS